MQCGQFRHVSRVLAAVLIIGTSAPAQVLADSESRDRERDGRRPIVTIDHFVPHISTVPANAGELVHLFVRERTGPEGLCSCSSSREGQAPKGDEDRGDRRREVVLMVHSRSVPVLAAMDLGSDDYNWALSLARAGIDVFMMDFQGSGRSPRPKMDDPCNVPETSTVPDQSKILIANERPLTTTCKATYPFVLTTSGGIDQRPGHDPGYAQKQGSDQDELDRVIDYIRELRGVDKVHLVSWSQGSFRIGPYAVNHPEKVASLFFLAPIFNTNFLPTTVDPKTLPRSGTPMTLRTRADVFPGSGFFPGWDVEVHEQCDGQREAGIQDVVWAALMDNDALGRTWWPSEGALRVREVTLWGWNKDVAEQLTVPTLIIRGEHDTGQGGRQDVHDLYGFVSNPNKLRFHVLCTGHFMLWEKQRTVLHDISKQWIKRGRVAGYEQGEFVVDTEGNVAPM